MNEDSLRELWRVKSDDELRMALRTFSQFDPVAQSIIRREAEERPAVDVAAEFVLGDPRLRMSDDKLMAALREPETGSAERELIKLEARRRSSDRMSGVTRADLMAIGMKLLGLYFLITGGADLIYTFIAVLPQDITRTAVFEGGRIGLPALISRYVLRSMCLLTAGIWLIVTGNKELERTGRASDSVSDGAV